MALATSPGWAERAAAECIAAHANAQELASLDKLLQARTLFESCASSDCPKLVQKDCRALGKSLEESIPSVALTVLDHRGQALTDFGVEIDGVRLAANSSRQALELDPGEHRLKIVANGQPSANVTIPVRAKEKHQSVVIQLAAPVEVSSSTRVPAYVLGGVGAAGVLSFAIFAILGYQDQHELEANSRRADSANDYALADSMRRKYLIADVSLGMGLVSLGAATYLLLTSRNASNHASSGAQTALYLDGFAGGGGLTVRREF